MCRAAAWLLLLLTVALLLTADARRGRARSRSKSKASTETRSPTSTTIITMALRSCLRRTSILSTCWDTRSRSCARPRVGRARRSRGSKMASRFTRITIYTRRSRSTRRRRWTRVYTSARPTTCTPSTGAPSRQTSPSPLTDSLFYQVLIQVYQI
ncbi:unnamed protein product [Leptidea sinapis]|uniref:Secreted protein n=1 Tax=Leptidea sinapis TaxID=189913 RepID=A0A5E4R383_9NEOP|nr:unnamed protein product [Leptidea sinapis]